MASESTICELIIEQSEDDYHDNDQSGSDYEELADDCEDFSGGRRKFDK